jgi:hypothetical protein
VSITTAAACYFTLGGKGLECHRQRDTIDPSHQHMLYIPLHLRVAISGSGFSRDRFIGGNTVYFGKSVCTVLNHKTSDTLVSSVNG